MSAPGRHGRIPAIMLQGTGSDVGKSLLVAGLARALTRRGLAVRPFKPQNMSNNAAVADGGEIGRAQALQARAAGVRPHVDMNPVLLKPQSETGAQVVVCGRVRGNATARDYHSLKPTLLPAVLESFTRLGADADIVLVEGAGSPAEVNLRAGDIANMGFAEAAGLPVVLIGDIERGGVIASLKGTCTLLPDEERGRIKGLIVNKFRGDVSLFDDASTIIENETGAPLLGVVPWFDGARILPKEDSASFDSAGADISGRRGASERLQVRIGVLRLPRIANFDDLDPLAAESGVALHFVAPGEALPGDLDAVILPGSKSTRADLADLRAAGWDIDIAAHVRRGGHVLGLCGGYQMLGHAIADPDGTEGLPGTSEGLGLLDIETTIGGTKALVEVAGTHAASGAMLAGYEMHMGETTGPDTARPWAHLEGARPDGATSADGQIAGTYVHGMFGSDELRHAWLAALGQSAESERLADWGETIETTLDALAVHLEAALDIDRRLEIADGR